MPHRVAFILAVTEQGTMIVNRMDQVHVKKDDQTYSYGVGFSLLEAANYEPFEIQTLKQALDSKRHQHGFVTMIDCGANIGTHTIPLARHMDGWGEVHAFEPQESIFYALCGNIALNNCFNAHAYRDAIGATVQELTIPVPDYQEFGSYGSLELRQTDKSEPIGQTLTETSIVNMSPIDDLNFGRIDVLKIDVERMELDVLHGAGNTLERYHPVIMMEWAKTDQTELLRLLTLFNYQDFWQGRNLLAVHKDDPFLNQLLQASKPSV